jgi:hypothetical protein
MAVMWWRSLTIAVFLFAIASALVVSDMIAGRANPVQVRVVNTAQIGTTKQVTVEFRRSNPLARFSEDLQVQTRAAGRWQPPERFPRLEDTGLLARTNCDQVLFSLPAGADACRFSLGYYLGSPPTCQVHGFFLRHGLYQKFPKFSRLVLKCVPRKPRLRHVELELVIPAEPQAAGSTPRCCMSPLAPVSV